MKKTILIYMILSFLFIVGCSLNSEKKILEELKPAENKLVLKSNDTTIVFNIENDMINSYHSYIKCNDNKASKEMLKNFKLDKNTIKKTYVEANYFIVEYNENSYKDLKVKDIKKIFYDFKEIK